MVILDKIYNSFNENKVVVGVFLDFQKAFDTINHEILKSSQVQVKFTLLYPMEG